MQFITFSVDNRHFAVDLASVERVVLAVALIPLPHAPKNIGGAIDVHGEIVPVIALRRVLSVTDRDLELTDQFIICQINETKAALWVDSVDDVAEYQAKDMIPPEKGMLAGEYVRWVIKDKDKTMLVCDWDKMYQLNLAFT